MGKGGRKNLKDEINIQQEATQYLIPRPNHGGNDDKLSSTILIFHGRDNLIGGKQVYLKLNYPLNQY